MKYEKDLMAEWDEYAQQKYKSEQEKALADEKKALEAEKKLMLEQGVETAKTEVVKNLLLADKFTIAEISNFANVSEAFVRKVKKELKQFLIIV